MRSPTGPAALLLAAALVVTSVLAAGCGTAAQPPDQTSGGSGGIAIDPSSAPAPASSLGDAASSAPGTASSEPGAASSEPGAASSAATRTRQTAITVVAPPGAPASASRAASSPVVVTTTVTVTPVPSHSTRASAHGTTAGTGPAHPKPPTTATASTRTPAVTTATGHTAAGHGALAGKVVVIDPGHNGANAAHPEIIHRQVPAGFGQYKDCNTTGTETKAGYPEYRFNWNVGLAVRDALRAKGITVVMTRDSDDGVGPCVNERAAIGNDAHADAVVSIHGDGESAGIEGFYVMTAERAPAGAAMAARSTALASRIRDGLSGAGFPVSNALGQDGLWTRSDLAGLNLSLRPTVMIECGNMRNATEAALMSSAKGQQRYAAGIVAGVLAFLGG